MASAASSTSSTPAPASEPTTDTEAEVSTPAQIAPKAPKRKRGKNQTKNTSAPNKTKIGGSKHMYRYNSTSLSMIAYTGYMSRRHPQF